MAKKNRQASSTFLYFLLFSYLIYFFLLFFFLQFLDSNIAIYIFLSDPYKALMWTEKESFDGTVFIKGILGDPETWVPAGYAQASYSYFGNPQIQMQSYRQALSFQYSTKKLFMSDRGFKDVYSITLQAAAQYRVQLFELYAGTSTQVNGLAMDWSSGSIYWTDALYNWITVANASDYLIYNHIVKTGLDRPMGIAVYPQTGFVIIYASFWLFRSVVFALLYEQLRRIFAYDLPIM